MESVKKQPNQPQPVQGEKQNQNNSGRHKTVMQNRFSVARTGSYNAEGNAHRNWQAERQKPNKGCWHEMPAENGRCGEPASENHAGVHAVASGERAE